MICTAGTVCLEVWYHIGMYGYGRPYKRDHSDNTCASQNMLVKHLEMRVQPTLSALALTRTLFVFRMPPS